MNKNVLNNLFDEIEKEINSLNLDLESYLDSEVEKEYTIKNNTLIVGNTGCGKSTLLKTIYSNTISANDNIGFIVFDPKVDDLTNSVYNSSHTLNFFNKTQDFPKLIEELSLFVKKNKQHLINQNKIQPQLIVLIDEFDTIINSFEGKEKEEIVEKFVKLVSMSKEVGINFVVTSKGFDCLPEIIVDSLIFNEIIVMKIFDDEKFKTLKTGEFYDYQISKNF